MHIITWFSFVYSQLYSNALEQQNKCQCSFLNNRLQTYPCTGARSAIDKRRVTMNTNKYGKSESCLCIYCSTFLVITLLWIHFLTQNYYCECSCMTTRMKKNGRLSLVNSYKIKLSKAILNVQTFLPQIR